MISSTSSSSASNSGPYTNITFDTGGYSGTSSTVCAQILNAYAMLTGTKGIRGLRCKSENQDAPAAVLLDSSNNSIEDVTIVGFFDGILVGKNASAQSNVLINIIGDTLGQLSSPVNAIHISNHNMVTDLSIVGVSNILSGTATYTIEDDVTLPSGSQNIADASVGIYAIGESIGGGYSRFTTSPSVATWAVGTSRPTSTSCSRGSLYSCTTALNNGNQCSNALWVCGPSRTWVAIQ